MRPRAYRGREGERSPAIFEGIRIMYGLVNKSVQELLILRFGEEMWAKVKAKAGIDLEVFISNEAYPDEITYRLVGAASALTGLSADDILFEFGEHWILDTSRKGYGALMDAGGKTFPEFLKNLPSFHTRVAMIFPSLRPPEFKVTDPKPNSVQLHYYSERVGLIPFVRGLLSGLGRQFGTPCRTSMLARKAEGADHDIFLVEWEAK